MNKFGFLDFSINHFEMFHWIYWGGGRGGGQEKAPWVPVFAINIL